MRPSLVSIPLPLTSLRSGWILLALAIALVNASSGIIVLYVLLTSIAWVLALWFIIRPLLVWTCRKTGSFGERGPTQGVVCAVIFLVLTSAWITDRIGVHAIFVSCRRRTRRGGTDSVVDREGSSSGSSCRTRLEAR